MNEDTYLSDEEELECPLCMEEFDISDRTFKPCPCGYQICRFCYNRIVNSESANGCPACRRQYTEETVEFKPLSAEEWKKDQQRIQSRKLKEKEKRESEMANRRHLSNMRVVQKNLVYVIGFSPKSADADLAATLRGNDYFAQYGKINKIVVNKKSHPNGPPTVGVYITYARKEDAARAVQAVNNTINDGRVLHASLGTTKYCSAYLRQQVCQNPNCMYLHEPGEDLDSYTREDMSTIQHAAKAADGMHANALAAHHMRRQPTRSDSTSTMNQESESSGAALPPTASWANLSKSTEPPKTTIRAADSSIASQNNAENHKPDSLPAPSQDSKELSEEIPPPPSQALHGAQHPSELLPPPVQSGLSHPVLGKIIKSLSESKFSFKFVAGPHLGLSEADIRAAENFPPLFAFNPYPARPSSPSKLGKNHARSGSRYAFASDNKSPPPGFVPPGLATGLQPPGFSAGEQSQSKESGTDFFSQFLRNSNPPGGHAGTRQGTASFEDPAILNLRESVKSPTDVAFNPQNAIPVAMPIGVPSGTPAHSPVAIHDNLDPSLKGSKYGAKFARLEHLENQAREITHKIDQRAKSSWEPAPRPQVHNRDAEILENINGQRTSKGVIQHPIAIAKSSGTWQPSPPPPTQVSPSPKPNAGPGLQRFGPSAFRSANKAPWEPSPPLTTRGKSPAGPSPMSPGQEAHSATPQPAIHNPIPLPAESKHTILAQEDFPALGGPRPLETPAPTQTLSQAPVKKQWDVVAPVVTSPLPSASPKVMKMLDRRDSAHSLASGMPDVTRSRQNSLTESLTSKIQTPTKGPSPASSPLSSRAVSPNLSTPVLHRTSSGAIPAVSSPLANLNTGKQIRILSSKATEELKIKADKSAAEERAVKKIKEEESAAAAKSIIRKSVPATSIKKSKEQKLAEQREKAEKREQESLASSQPDDTAPPAEIAPIIGRARKQKNKQAKTPVKATPTKQAAPVTDAENTPDNEQIELRGHEEEASGASKTAASDAISELSKAMDLKSFKFFQSIPGLNHNYHFTPEELTKGAELAQWVPYQGKESVEQLETMLTHARREANEHHKALEKLQKKNTRLARLDVGVSV